MVLVPATAGGAGLEGGRVAACVLCVGGKAGGVAAAEIWEFPKIRGTLFWGPDNKDPTILGTILIGSPYFRKLPYVQ